MCTNSMVVDAWKVNPYPEYVGCQNGNLEADEGEDKVDDQIPVYPQRISSSLTRSSSFNRIHLSLPHRKLKRSVSSSGAPRPDIKPRLTTDSPKVSASTLEIPREEYPAKDKLKRSNSVLSRLARSYSRSRSRRSSSTSSKEMNPSEDNNTTAAASKGRLRRRNKNSKKEAKPTTAKLLMPKSRSGRGHSPEPRSLPKLQSNGDIPPSSPESIPNSPSHFQTSFTVSPPSPDRLKSGNFDRAISPTVSADDSPLPSPHLEDKAYDSGRMSMSSLRSFSSGRPTSMSSVTSSISSRTSRGSDYFSSASSGGPDQITSHRFGLQTALPELNESESSDRLAGEAETANVDKDAENKSKRRSSARNSRSSAFVAHDRHNKDLNDVDHLSPVANLAMVVNPDLSYNDRVILELLETERMYVKSMRDILTGYLSVIRSNPGLNIPSGDVDDLFGNIRDLYDFNRNLLGELEDCQGDPQQIAECFASRDDDYKVYTEYCTNYPCSVAAMTRCMKNPHLVDFFKAQQDNLRHTLPLGSYLLKPVQRVLKYHLLLQELVKHGDKTDEGYQTIEKALQTMTRVARHINEMKRKHEDAVHIQEIQSYLLNWQGSELTQYGELILESEMKMQGAKNDRQVYLFEKMILITKKREDGFLVCKANIMCSKLIMLESVPNTPLGFQVQAHENKSFRKSNEQQADNTQAELNKQPYVLLASTQEEKNKWTYHIKHLIIETLKKAVPSDARDRLLRPVRDGDMEGNPEDFKKAKSRFGSSTRLGGQDNKPTKSPLARLTSNPSPTSLPPANQMKNRRRSDSMSRKTLHKKALQKRGNEIESSDDISADSSPNTPSGIKVGGKFSFPSFRQSTRSGSAAHTNKHTTTHAQNKSNQGKANGDLKKSVSMKPSELKKSNSNENGEVVKRHHNSVIYRRHKRRTSQPITYTEKRLSMKLTEDEGENDAADGDQALDEEDFLNFNPLTARESVSWDIQIVEAVFERYKNEDTSPTTPPGDSDKKGQPDLESGSSVIALDHAPTPKNRRKSKIVVLPRSNSSDEEKTSTKRTKPVPAVLRRRRSKNGQNNKITSGVVYTYSQELDVESDSGLNETKSIMRKVVQASENARKSLVIHESDTEVETNHILIEKANTVRRKSSLKRKERNARRRLQSGSSANDNNNNVTQHIKSQQEIPNGKRKSLYDNLSGKKEDMVVKAAVTSSVQCMSTPTISMVDSKYRTTTVMTSVQSGSPTTIVSTSVASRNTNCNNNVGMKPLPVVKKVSKNIPSGRVRGLIERLRGHCNADVIVVASNAKRTPLTSPTFAVNPKEAFVFKPTDVTNSRDSATTNQVPCKDSTPTKTTVTTESLPLTLTSSSESEDETSAKASRHKKGIRLNRATVEDSKKYHPIPQIYLRRTFSQDSPNSHTRHTTNLLLESRVSEQFASSETPTVKQEVEEFKFEGVESVGDGEHYLLERLCLGPPEESKITDKMSEEFEHVCSELENSRLNSVDSHNFSTSEDEKSASQKSGRLSRRDLATRLSERKAFKAERKSSSSKYEQKESSNIAQSNVSAAGGKTLNTEQIETNDVSSRRYGQRNSRTLPSRTDSLRSTKSEYLSSRRDVTATRGRSSASSHRGSLSQHRYPSKDMHAIPQMNVARLAKQFNDNCTQTETKFASTPRRSKSVGGAARTRKRLQEKQDLMKKSDSSVKNHASIAHQATPSKSVDVTPPRNRSHDPKNTRKGGNTNRLEKAAIKVEEVQFCQATDFSVKLHKAASVEEESVVSPKSIGDDDVFDNSATPSDKKKSLIEMFAVNPKHKSDSDNQSPNKETNRNFKPLKLNSSSTSNVRAVLARTPDKEEGRGGFDPKVINSPDQSSAERHSDTPRPLEKRKSWSNLSPSSEEPKRRTRLRSSSLSRARMRAAMSPNS